MLDLNHLFLTIVISFLSFRVFLFLGLVGMSYSLWMWIRNGVIFIMILYAPILFFTLTFKGKFCKYFYFSFSFSRFSFFWTTFTFRAHSVSVFWTALTFSHLSWTRCSHQVETLQKTIVGFLEGFNLNRFWTQCKLNAALESRAWVVLKEKLLFSSDCEQCLCPKATPKGRNILSAHEAHQPLWRHRRCCLWQGEDFDGGDSEGRVMMILATHWSNWGWFWLHAVLDD